MILLHLLCILIILSIVCKLNKRIHTLQSLTKKYYILYLRSTHDLEKKKNQHADLLLDHKSLTQFDGKE